MRLFAMCVLVCACESTDPCGQLTVDFPEFARDADEITVENGGARAFLSHTAGQASECYQVAVSGEVRVSALRGGMVVASSTAQVASTGGRARVDLAVSPRTIRAPQKLNNKVDLLFLVDDSPSMGPKQRELAARFPEMIRTIELLKMGGQPASYHIGVVSSDLGAGPTQPVSNCKPGGLGGRLQPLGRAHDPACQPPNGNFIDYNQLDGTNNLPSGQDLATTFSCMAQVGDQSCGFEHQLEAVYQALNGCMPDAHGEYPNCTIPENRGFLRPDSLLVVVFVTDEDDCSAPPDSDLFQLDPGAYGPLFSYRCARFGVVCDGALLPDGPSNGPLQKCHAAPNPGGAGPGKLYDVSRYIDFFKQLRQNPNDLVLASLAAPVGPVEVKLLNPSTLEPCTAPGASCTPTLAHSCGLASDSLAGDPPVRLSEVIRSVKSYHEASICDASYAPAMTGLGGMIENELSLGCLPAPLADQVQPDCVVRDVFPGGTEELPACGTPPCWRVVDQASCPARCAPGGATQRLAIIIERGGTAAAPLTVSEITCKTLNVDLTSPPVCGP